MHVLGPKSATIFQYRINIKSECSLLKSTVFYALVASCFPIVYNKLGESSSVFGVQLPSLNIFEMVTSIHPEQQMVPL